MTKPVYTLAPITFKADGEINQLEPSHSGFYSTAATARTAALGQAELNKKNYAILKVVGVTKPTVEKTG